jgi:hypothetical protein
LVGEACLDIGKIDAGKGGGDVCSGLSPACSGSGFILFRLSSLSKTPSPLNKILKRQRPFLTSLSTLGDRGSDRQNSRKMSGIERDAAKVRGRAGYWPVLPGAGG